MTADGYERVVFPQASSLDREVRFYSDECGTSTHRSQVCSRFDCTEDQVSMADDSQVRLLQSEVDSFDGCIAAFVNRSREILAQIDDHACWVAFDHDVELDSECNVQSTIDKRVTFSSEVTVVVSSGQETRLCHGREMFTASPQTLLDH